MNGEITFQIKHGKHSFPQENVGQSDDSNSTEKSSKIVDKLLINLQTLAVLYG